MSNFTPEMIEKAKVAKTAEELLEIAKANGMEITAEEAATYFAQLNPKSGELDDDDLDNVAGGSCYNKNGYLKITSSVQVCDLFDCGCGSFYPAKFDALTKKCGNCNLIAQCSNCTWYVEGGWSSAYCSNPATRKS